MFKEYENAARQQVSYLLIFLLQFGRLCLIWSLIFGTLSRPELPKLLGNLSNGDAWMFFLDSGTMIRAEDEESGTTEKEKYKDYLTTTTVQFSVLP